MGQFTDRAGEPLFCSIITIIAEHLIRAVIYLKVQQRRGFMPAAHHLGNAKMRENNEYRGMDGCLCLHNAPKNLSAGALQ